MQSKNTDTKESIDKRTRRAAIKSMFFGRHVDEAGEYDIYSVSGSVYRMNVIVGKCDCPSGEYQEGRCKHVRRVEMETGQWEVPNFDKETDVQQMIAAWTDQQAAETDQPEAMTDGG